MASRASRDETTRLQYLLDRYQFANEAEQTHAFDDLIDYASRRLRSLARKMLARYPHVRRWEETDDVMQAALLRLHRSLSEVRPDSKRAFFGLAATQMRRTLIDLARHYYGAHGHGKNHHSVAGDRVNQGNSSAGDAVELAAARETNREPDDLQRWTDFHEAIDQLLDEEKEVISLVWYGGMLQKEVAELLEVSERTVIRRMNRAKLSLNELMGGSSPQA